MMNGHSNNNTTSSGAPLVAPSELFQVFSHSPPRKTLQAIVDAGVNKCGLPWHHVLISSCTAGAYIAFGGLVTIIVCGGFTGAGGFGVLNPGFIRLIAGAIFPVGLVLVTMTNAELFTGNLFVLMPSWWSKKTLGFAILRNLGIAYIGNFIGCVMVAYFLTHLAELSTTDPYKAYIVKAATTKIGLGWGVAFLRGIGANWLVCLAIWSSANAGDTLGKIAGVWWSIFCFVACNFEHSIANMYFCVVGLMEGIPYSFWEFLGKNLIPVTLGNMVGGIIFMGMVQWYIWRPTSFLPTRQTGASLAEPSTITASSSTDVNIGVRGEQELTRMG